MSQPISQSDEYVEYIIAAVHNVPYSRRFSRLASKCRLLGMYASSTGTPDGVTLYIQNLLYNVCLGCKNWLNRNTVHALVRVPREMESLEEMVDEVCRQNGIWPQLPSIEEMERDEEKDWKSIMRITMTRLSHQGFQDECLTLQSHEAEDMMKVMHRILIQSVPDDPNRAQAFNILNSLSDRCNKFATVRTVTLDGKEEYITSRSGVSISMATHNGNQVAVKRFRFHSGKEAESMLRREILLWDLITQRHQPHILPLIGLMDSQFPLIKMVAPWQENGNLSNFVQPPLATTINRLRLLAQLCSALQFLHNHVPVVIHANLKCENVLVDREGSPYLAGLGLTTVRRSGAITEGGSTRWMAPELFMNSEGNTVDLEDSVPTLKATCYSDIWSFAMLALELLTGKIPFPDKYPNATVMYALINGERPKQPQRRSSTENGLNNELWGYLLRCWNPSPQNRLPLQSLYDVLDRLATQWRPVAQILGPRLPPALPTKHLASSQIYHANVIIPVAGKSSNDHTVEITDMTQKFEEAKLQNEKDEGLRKTAAGRLPKVNQQKNRTEHKHLQEDHLKNEGAKSIRGVEKKLTMTVTEAKRVQHEEEHVNRATLFESVLIFKGICFNELQQGNPDVSYQTNPIKWIRCNREHVLNLARTLLSQETPIGNIYPRFTVYTLACISSMNASRKTKYAKLSDLVKVLGSWMIWDDISALANHQTVKSHLLKCLKSINKIHGTVYRNSGADLAHILNNDAISIDALLLSTLQDRARYKQLIKRRGQEAQSLLNLLQARLGFPLNPSLKRFHLEALIKLSRSSGLYPECMTLTGINIEVVGTAAVDFGGYGDIWKGLLGGKEIGVKVLRISHQRDKVKFLKDFSSEAVIWRQLHHPNVLPFYGVFHLEGGRLCLASPWMNNGNVVRFLESAPKTECVPLMLDIAKGLNYLHKFKPSIIHGDIKGVNILITQSGRACLADFGLAAAKGSQSMAVTTAMITRAAGTLRWQAPELLEDDDVCNSPASDVYAYACVCYELFSGEWPFHDIQKDFRVIGAVTQGNRPLRPLDDRCSVRGLNDEVWSIIETCWAQEPDQRPSADRIVGRLRSLISRTDDRPHDEVDPTFPCRTLYSQAEHPFSALATMGDEQLA